MDWNGLWLNLLSEGLGILFTVLIIDRLLAWRERRSWDRVREIFLAQSEFVSDSVWKEFEIWLEALAQFQDEAPGSQERASAGTAVLAHFNELYSTSNTRAPRSKDAEFAAIATQLQKALESSVFPQPLRLHPSWTAFRGAVSPILDRFERVIAGYSPLVTPEFAVIGMQLRRDLDLLDVLEQNWTSESSEQADYQDRVAGLIASQLLHVARLTQYVRRHRKSSSSPWFPSLE